MHTSMCMYVAFFLFRLFRVGNIPNGNSILWRTEQKQVRLSTPNSQENTWTPVPTFIEIPSRETIAGVLVFQSCTNMRTVTAHSVQSEFG